MPKRKHAAIESEATVDSGVAETEESRNGFTNGIQDDGRTPPPKRRKGVRFEKVDVFYFPRAQGFACVPSQGGTTLGMSDKHAHQEEYPLKHYRKLRKLVRRRKADIEETAENSFNIDSINEISQDEIVQTDSEEDDTETDGFFLQPVPTKLRRSLLKLSGVKKLDVSERDECKELRGSREQCGCDCQTECLPDTCLCAQNGIQCQVDRYSFPCGCTKKGCQNPAGRIEFNPVKVQKHYHHTMSRLGKEQKAELLGSPKGHTSIKKASHIRFADDDDVVEGEKSLNSTETGCCLDCSLTTLSNDNQLASSHIHPVYESNSHDQVDSSFSVFCSTAVNSESNPPTSSYTVAVANANNTSNKCPPSLEPISGLLNPILNTADSLDMYQLAHLHNSTADAVADSDITTFTYDTVSEWQNLSHESLLTAKNLIPVNDEDCISSNDLNSFKLKQVSLQEQIMLQSDDLPPKPLSFQFCDESMPTKRPTTEKNQNPIESANGEILL